MVSNEHNYFNSYHDWKDASNMNSWVEKLLEKIPEQYQGIFLDEYKKKSKSERSKYMIDAYFYNRWTISSSNTSNSNSSSLSRPKRKATNEDEVIYDDD